MKITAHSLDILHTQKLSLPTGAKLLTVNVDHRFNKCLLWTFQDDNAPPYPSFPAVAERQLIESPRRPAC